METMKAIAVHRREEDKRIRGNRTFWAKDTIHLRDDVAVPTLGTFADGRGVVLRVLQVGVCGTDREIGSLGEYGVPPPGAEYLVLGHECLAQVVEVGLNVTSVKVGDLVTPTVRRPGKDRYSRIRYQDLTSDEEYFERGISKLHGFLCATVVEHEEFLVQVDPAVAEVGVLLEPMSIIQKALRTAFAVQHARLPFYDPRNALITGSGPIGLLAAMTLRLRGLAVVVVASRSRGDNERKADLVDGLGATYVGTEDRPLGESLKGTGPFDLVLDATGSSKVAFEVLHQLAKNGLCIWTSITGGTQLNPVRTDEINQAAVLGNQAILATVNAHLCDFESGVREFARGLRAYPGWLPRLLSHRVDGLDDYEKIAELLATKQAVKVWVEVSARDA